MYSTGVLVVRLIAVCMAETNTTTALSHMQPAVEQLTRHMSNATRLANAKLDVWREDVSM